MALYLREIHSMGKKIIITFILIFIAAFLNYSFAADTASHKYPQLILVQLRSEQNRKQALEDARKYVMLKEVEEDATHAADAMINDFRDHFKYCPVYYYADTNAEAIKKKQFDGILLHADGTEAKNVTIGNDNYFIVYYGYPNLQEKKSKKATDELTPYAGKGLVILNNVYEQIACFFLLQYNESFFRKDKKNSKYAFSSKHFDIQYVPLAEDFNAKITDKPYHSDFRGSLHKPGN